MDQIYKQIVSLQHRCDDYIDDPSASSARTLQKEIQKLEDEAQVQKNPTSLAHRSQAIARMCNKIGDSGAMSHHHADELADKFENLSQKLRKM